MIDNIYHNCIMLIIITLIVALLITIAIAIRTKENFIVDYRILSFANQQIIFDYWWPYYYTGMNASFLDLYALELPLYQNIPVPYNYVITNQL